METFQEYLLLNYGQENFSEEVQKLDIWLVTIGEFLPLDAKATKHRTALLADKLVERGHNVLWWTSAFNHFKKDWVFKEDTLIDVKEGYKIYALKGIGYKKNISLSRFIDHRIIAWKFKRIAPKMPKPDVIVASMPPHDLAYEAVMFAKKNNIPVLVDIRDPWPDIFLNHIPLKFRGLAKIALYNDFRMIKKTMQMADGLIAVTNTFLEWGLRYAGRKKDFTDKVYYLGSKKLSLSNISKAEEKFSPILEKLRDKFIVFFVGTFASYHNPSILLKAAERLSEHNIYFVIAGDGEFFEQLKKNSTTLTNVSLTGWLNQDEIEFWLQQSKIGVCPTTKEIDLFPNKAFTYLSAGLPIISAFQGDLKEIIEKYQIGFYYPPNDVDALAECIMKLYNNPDLYKKMSENARRVFDVMFDADKIYTEYAEHIERVALKSNRR
ncbi:MAG: glycosyltransferase family 4 protein [candidate division WOR-3 bacterium]